MSQALGRQTVGELVAGSPSRVWWLSGITIAWMSVEASVALHSALGARSPALLAFGADSVVELLSAIVVLLSVLPWAPFNRKRSEQIAGSLLFVLAGVVTAVALLGLWLRLPPETSRAGVAITAAALLVMPGLAALKRREGRRTGNGTLVADAAQSATCAYLASVALLGLALNALLHIGWFDTLAALLAVPLIVREGLQARRGLGCACH